MWYGLWRMMFRTHAYKNPALGLWKTLKAASPGESTNWQLKRSLGVWVGHWLIGQHEELPAALHCVTAQSEGTPWRVPSICMKVDCHSCPALPCGVTLPASHCLCVLLFTFLFSSLPHCNFSSFATLLAPVSLQCLSQGRYFAAKLPFYCNFRL